jgi:type I restriction enzyme S subunit
MNLPETWIETTVGQVILNLQPGFAQRPGEEGKGTVPQIRTHNVSPDGKLTTAGIKHVTPSEQELSKYKLMIGDVIFNNTNSEEWVGKTAVFDVEGNYVFSNHMTRLRVNPTLIAPTFLATYLQILWAQGYSKTRAKRWVSQAAIESRALTSFKLPLPTLPEQLRIIEVLRQLGSIGEERTKARKIASQLACESFIELFGHPAENLYNFETLPLSDFGVLERGVSKHRPRDAAHLYGGPYPFIQTGDVSNAGDWITSYSSTYSEAGLNQSRLWPKGTLCITIAANIARTAMLDFDACFPDSVVGFTPFDGVHTEYVLYCLRFYQEFLEHRAPKSAQMNINLDTLRRLHMPKPPEDMQKRFSDFVRQLRVLGEGIRVQTEKHDVLMNELSLAAFSGELTQQWRNENIESLRQESAQERRKHGEGKPIIVKASILEQVRPYRELKIHEPERGWLIEQLSTFQHDVRRALYDWKGTLIADDPEMLDDFCRKWPVENDENLQDQIRRVLDQLASMGLIAKISIRTQDDEGKIRFLIGYRFLRDEERTQTSDVSRLEKLLMEAVE